MPAGTKKVIEKIGCRHLHRKLLFIFTPCSSHPPNLFKPLALFTGPSSISDSWFESPTIPYRNFCAAVIMSDRGRGQDHRFAKKLQGAAARLFAAACENYVQAANDDCNDKPNDIPIFCRLSPQQRVKLVRDVMIGLLCENEPLPPNTVQHSCAHLAIVATIVTQIEVEVDMAGNFDDIRKELLELDEDFRCQRRNEKLTEEDREERKRQLAAIDARAARNKDKLKLKGKEGKLKDYDAGEESVDNVIGRFEKITKSLFKGPPISKEKRSSLLPLTDDEKCAFYWRLLSDETLQEGTTPVFLFPPTCAVDFDFRCRNMDKWGHALNMVLVSNIWNAGSHNEHGLIFGPINAFTYADPSQHPRILAVDKNVKLLRAVYDRKWDPTSVGDDQRCIYAVCSDEIYGSKEHKPWLTDFVTRLREAGCSPLKRGSYQKRFEVYQELKLIHEDKALLIPFAYFALSPWTPPIEYKDTELDCFEHCSGPAADLLGMQCFLTENLRECSNCGVIKYCSRKCQAKDWKRHKKECATLALLRKDKKKVAKLARSL